MVKSTIINKMATLPKRLTTSEEKDFIKENILRVKHSCPPKVKRQFVDTRYGDMHNLNVSGLFPIHIYKKNYGNVPKLITNDIKIKEALTTEIKKYNLDEDKIVKLSSCRYIDQEERRILLESMKQKWDETMKLFQRSSFLTDTLPKAQRKAKMERKLQQLEKDIEIIERHLHIYVYDNNEAKC